MIYSIRFKTVSEITSWYNDNNLDINIISIFSDIVVCEYVVLYEIC